MKRVVKNSSVILIVVIFATLFLYKQNNAFIGEFTDGYKYSHGVKDMNYSGIISLKSESIYVDNVIEKFEVYIKENDPFFDDFLIITKDKSKLTKTRIGIFNNDYILEYKDENNIKRKIEIKKHSRLEDNEYYIFNKKELFLTDFYLPFEYTLEHIEYKNNEIVAIWKNVSGKIKLITHSKSTHKDFYRTIEKYKDRTFEIIV